MNQPRLLWRRANKATLKTLRGEYKGQYHIILGRTEPITGFFAGLPRKVDRKGSSIDVWTEPVPEGEEESPPWRLVVRRNSAEMARPDEWYISSQVPGSAHPLWRPGVGPKDGTEPETDYVILLRTPKDEFYAGWLDAGLVEGLPEDLRAKLEKAKVSAAEIKTEEAEAVLAALDQKTVAGELAAEPGESRPEDEEPAPPPVDPEVDDETGAQEGQPKLVQHLRRERSSSLRRKRVALAGGRPRCEICGFDFEQAYGERGRGYIECHHKIPLPEIDPATPTRLEDLALVCANCHRMIHARRPWLEIEELAELLTVAAAEK
ncbi:MAG TPA: HNH endonuclease [Solirubrobacterales bacterium]|nr:HNH endonuclease [Solirubrobacterales bacterium]